MPTSVHSAARPPPKAARSPATTRQMLAWAMFDWANSAFFALIVTFVFAAYFTRAVLPDPVAGAAAWGQAITVSALLIAIVNPVVGAIADAGGRRKPWLVACTLIGGLATASLWWVTPTPDAVPLALALVVVANVATEIGQSFYNAMLPDLAPRASLGRWSGRGWAAGYLGSIVALLLLLTTLVQPDPPPFGLDAATAEPVRMTGPFVGAWMILFALPLLLLVPDRPGRLLPMAEAVSEGWRRLRATLGALRGQPNLVRFLVSRAIYNDGLTTLFAFGGIYAATSFDMSSSEIIYFGVALNLAAGAGALFLAPLDDRLGSKRAILLALGGLGVTGLGALLTTDKTVFWAAGMGIGVFLGPAQSASRSLMARLGPPERMAELFGLYAMSGKVTSFLGPLLFAGATAIFETTRAGLASILAMLALGGFVLTFVQEPARGS